MTTLHLLHSSHCFFKLCGLRTSPWPDALQKLSEKIMYKLLLRVRPDTPTTGNISVLQRYVSCQACAACTDHSPPNTHHQKKKQTTNHFLK